MVGKKLQVLLIALKKNSLEFNLYKYLRGILLLISLKLVFIT